VLKKSWFSYGCSTLKFLGGYMKKFFKFFLNWHENFAVGLTAFSVFICPSIMMYVWASTITLIGNGILASVIIVPMFVSGAMLYVKLDNVVLSLRNAAILFMASLICLLVSASPIIVYKLTIQNAFPYFENPFRIWWFELGTIVVLVSLYLQYHGVRRLMSLKNQK